MRRDLRASTEKSRQNVRDRVGRGLRLLGIFLHARVRTKSLAELLDERKNAVESECLEEVLGSLLRLVLGLLRAFRVLQRLGHDDTNLVESVGVGERHGGGIAKYETLHSLVEALLIDLLDLLEYICVICHAL